MNCKIDEIGGLYGLLDLSKDVDQVVFPILIKIFKREKIQDCLEFLSDSLNLRQEEQKIQKGEYQSLFGKEQMINVGRNTIIRITDILKKLLDHEFSEKNYSIDEYEEITNNLILKISWDKKIIEFLKFLVHLTALDDRYIQCGSNSLHLLVLMKVDLKESCFENIRIRNTSIIGANLISCVLSGSEFDDVLISGVNLNQAKLFNCKWRNLRINELNMMNGHSDWVNQICFSPDGKQLVSCSDDNSIILWDVKIGIIKSIIRAKGEIKSICFSPNKSKLAFGSGKFVYLWNFKTRKQIQKFDVHSKNVSSICFSPNGTILASCSGDKSILLWDVKTGQQKAKLDGHKSRVNSICYSPDGTTLASGCEDNSIRLWDVKTGLQKAKLDGHTSAVNSICYSPDGTTLASGSDDNSIRLWNVKTGQQKAKLDGHSDWVKTIFYSPDGTSLASGSEDNSIRLWDVKTGQQKAKLDGHTSTVNSICYSPDGTTLASGSYDNSIRLWDVKTGQQKAQLDGHSGTVNSVNFSPDGTTLASGSQDNSIHLRDVKTGQQILSSDNRYQNILAQFQPSIFKNNVISESVNSNVTILLISQQLIFQSQGALILQGQFHNPQGIDLRTLFQQRGSLILENLIQQQQHQD